MRYLALYLVGAALVGALLPALGGPAAAALSASPPAPLHEWRGVPEGRGEAAAASYLFVPGNIIDITGSRHAGYDRTIPIQPDGRIQFPEVGEIVAAGLTSAQLAARIQQGLNTRLVDPQVTVSLKELNKQSVRRVSVLGAVKNPGVFELKEKSTLAELLAAAGGPTPIADLRRITVTRADGSKKVVADLSGAARTGELSQNLVLEPADLIWVPEGTPPTVS